MDTKAGIIRDTISGSVASFVPDATIDNLLGLDVHLEPIQDLHGYDSPWPAGGGVNKLSPVANPGSKTMNGMTVQANEDGTFSLSGTTSGGSFDNTYALSAEYVVQDGDYIHVHNSMANSSSMILLKFSDNTQVSVFLSIVDKSQSLSEAVGKTVTQIRFYIASGVTLNGTVSPEILNSATSNGFHPYRNLCPISGRESVEVETAGVNLLNVSQANEVRKNGAAVFTLDYLGNNSVRMNTSTVGALSVIWELFRVTQNMVGKRIVKAAPSTFFYKTKNADGDWTPAPMSYASNVSIVTFTAEDVGKAFGLGIYNDTGAIKTFENLQVEWGETSSDFVPYVGTTRTIPLPETVYGGDIGVVSGDGEKKMAMVDLGTLNFVWTNSTKTFSSNAISESIKPPKTNSDVANIICTSLAIVKASSVKITDCSIGVSSAGIILVKYEAYDNDLHGFLTAISGVMLCYELATPTSISTTPTEISTVEGENNVFSPDGDVTVEYAVDLKTFLNTK